MPTFMRISQGVSELRGSKIAISRWQGHGLYNSLHYHTSCDDKKSLMVQTAVQTSLLISSSLLT